LLIRCSKLFAVTKRSHSAVFRNAVWGTLAILLASLHSPSVAQNLATVRTIFIAPVDAGANAAAIGKRLASQLERSGSVRVVSDQADADATLNATASIWATGTISPNLRSGSTHEVNYQGHLSAELISRDRQTLWSYMVTPSRFRTASIVDDLSDQLAARLLNAVRSGIPYPTAPNATSSAASVTIQAAGSTLPAPLYLKWFESYARTQPGTVILYDPIGSDAGIAKLKAGLIDFAGSDIPLPTSDTTSILHFPTVLGGVVPIYNLPSLNGRTLNLTPQALAGIYSGAIRKWNDPAIRNSNHGLHLPDADIAVIHRSDGSGTSYIWTSFFSLSSPEWKSRYGSGPHVDWPVGTGAQGSEGIAQLVQQTPNSIGYVELIYAVQNQISYAAVQNPAGQFVKADLDSIIAAVPDSALSQSGDSRLSILNTPGRNAYPISAFTWILLPAQSSDPRKREAILEFLRWMLTSGQKECEALGYAPLPRRIVTRELNALNSLPNGK
jgi:phosphate ABC transporter phosphate-binding protein